MNPLLIYIAGPYTGQEVKGTANQILVAQRIAHAGHFPYAPLWLHYADMANPSLENLSYEYCLDHCLHVLTKCDALVRLPGDSKGADREWHRAQQLGLDTIYLPQLNNYLELQRVRERSWKIVKEKSCNPSEDG